MHVGSISAVDEIFVMSQLAHKSLATVVPSSHYENAY